MSLQAEGEYAEALQNYGQAMRLEVDPYDRSFIFYNIITGASLELFWGLSIVHILSTLNMQIDARSGF